MRMPTRSILYFSLVFLFPAVFPAVHAQSNSGTVTGTVTDPTGAVIVCAGIAQVGHIHPGGQAVQSDCALCHTAHAVVQPPISYSLPRTVRIVAAIATALQPNRANHFSIFSLFTRPPPVDVAFA